MRASMTPGRSGIQLTVEKETAQPGTRFYILTPMRNRNRITNFYMHFIGKTYES